MKAMDLSPPHRSRYRMSRVFPRASENMVYLIECSISFSQTALVREGGLADDQGERQLLGEGSVSCNEINCVVARRSHHGVRCRWGRVRCHIRHPPTTPYTDAGQYKGKQHQPDSC
jgi:hypothetical protein